jgi:hypothetical protein
MMGKKEKKKIPLDGPGPREEIVRAVEEKGRDGGLACAVAHKMAGELGVEPREVGLAADMIGVAIVKCQLGLFGYSPEKRIAKPASEVSPDLKEAIQKSLKEGRLSCADAWKIADDRGLPRMAVASACEAMRIKISSCQLGAF